MKKPLIAVLLVCLVILVFVMSGSRGDRDSAHFATGREYQFVRLTQGKIETAVFTRFHDGSANVMINGGETIEGYELGDQAWRRALNRLRSRGFVEKSGLTGPGPTD